MKGEIIIKEFKYPYVCFRIQAIVKMKLRK